MPKSETSELVTILKKLQQELQHFREDTEERLANIETGSFRVRAELKEETKAIKRKLTEIKDDQNSIIRFFNEDFLKLEKRVRRAEDHINIKAD